MKLLLKLKCWWLSKWCPSFYEKMPEDACGKYRAIVYTQGLCGFRSIKYNEPVEGRQMAYIKAREMALKADLTYVHPEIGIYWEIEEVK